MRIEKVSDFVNILSNNKNLHVTVKQVGLDCTATKVGQVVRRVLVTTVIDTRKRYHTLQYVN